MIINDNEMVDVDLRKPIFCFFIEMSDDSVGVEADYHEKVRNLFRLICCYQYRILVVIGKMARWLMWTEWSRFYVSHKDE